MDSRKLFMVEGIKNLMYRDYNLSPEYLDAESLVDSSLSFGENWKMIKPLVV